MTGYGRAVGDTESRTITVEIKSLNSKQFDLSCRMPSVMRECEVDMRNLLASLMERGKTDCIVTLENTSEHVSMELNYETLFAYKDQIEMMSRSLKIPMPHDTEWYNILLRMPDVMHADADSLGEDDVECLMTTVRNAYANLREFRVTEGKRLYQFFVEKIENIRHLLEEVEPFEAERVERIKSKLEENLKKLTSIEYEPGRLEQEMIFYIEKLDVTEEKTRLRSHLNYFMETLGGEELPAQGQGKKLGFIAQEMGREINTLGSKSNNADMQRIVVKMKDELEQIKEQVLNVL